MRRRAFQREVLKRFDAIDTTLSQIKRQNIQERRRDENMSAQLDTLRREVEESRTVSESAAALIAGLAEQIRDAQDDPAALQALADSLDAQQTALGNAITANTPAA